MAHFNRSSREKNKGVSLQTDSSGFFDVSPYRNSHFRHLSVSDPDFRSQKAPNVKSPEFHLYYMRQSGQCQSVSTSSLFYDSICYSSKADPGLRQDPAAVSEELKGRMSCVILVTLNDCCRKELLDTRKPCDWCKGDYIWYMKIILWEVC